VQNFVARKSLERAAEFFGDPRVLDSAGALELLQKFVPYDTYCICGLPIPGRGFGTGNILAHNGPDDFFAAFVDKRWFERCGITLAYKSAGDVVSTRDAEQFAAADPFGRTLQGVIDELLGDELIGIPIRLRGPGLDGSVTLLRHGDAFSETESLLMQLLAPGLHAKAAALALDNLRPRLSERERECLAWASVGKTAWEISEILNISEHTVVAHLNAATRKLGAVSRGHAIAQALRLGVID
jgi:DNA-binding CsgD family transcriptional regulator